MYFTGANKFSIHIYFRNETIIGGYPQQWYTYISHVDYHYRKMYIYRVRYITQNEISKASPIIRKYK